MVLTLLGNQKVPGTPSHAQSVPTEQSPGTNFLAGFSFSHIGQEPSLLKRLKSADHEQELQYPLSPSTSLPDETPINVASREISTSGTGLASSIVAPRNSTPLREVSYAHTPASLITGSSLLPVQRADASGPSMHKHDTIQPNGDDMMDSSSSHAPAGEAPLSNLSDASSALLRPSPFTSARASLCSPSQEARAPVTREPSPADLVARISQVALERAEWGDMNALMERYYRESNELLKLKEESARASQRETEQALKVWAVIDAAFSKLKTLHLRQGERLAEEQQRAESALADAQRVIADRNAREAAEVAERAGAAPVAAAEKLFTAQVGMDERHMADEENAKRLAEEANRLASLEAQRRCAEQERREAEKNRIAEQEQHRIAAEAAAEEVRRKDYEARRAEVVESKRLHLEAQRIEARQKQENRSRPAKEDIKARLEKQKRTATSRSTSVSSSSMVPPTNVEDGKSFSNGNSSEINVASAVTVQPHAASVGPSSSTSSSLSAQPVRTQISRSHELESARSQVQDSHTIILPPKVGQRSQQGGIAPSCSASNGKCGQQATSRLPSDALSHADLHSPEGVSQACIKPETDIPHLLPARGMASPGASEQPVMKHDQTPKMNVLPARPAKASKAALQAGQNSDFSRRDALARQVDHVVVKEEHSADLGNSVARTFTVPQGVIIQDHIHEQSSTGHSIRPSAVVYPSHPGDATGNLSSAPPVVRFDTVHASQPSLAERLSAPRTHETLSGSYEASGEMDPWVNTPVVGEGHPHRPTNFRNEGRYARPAYNRYSPSRATTPPRDQRVVSRERAPYAPSSALPTMHREGSPASRKRKMPNGHTWVNNDEPLPRRPKMSFESDSQWRRVIAPDGREHPVRPTVDNRNGRRGPSPQRPNSPYNSGYDQYPHEAYSQNHHRLPTSYDNDRLLQPALQVEHTYAPGPAHTDSFSRESPRSIRQRIPLQQRILDAEPALLPRNSDSADTAQAPSRNIGRVQRSPTRNRGNAAVEPGRGRSNPIRGGKRQQRPLQSRLTVGGGSLSDRLS